MKFAKPFLGVPDGEVYPRQYQPGEDCPPELVDGARSLDALEAPAPPPPPEPPAADPENTTVQTPEQPTRPRRAPADKAQAAAPETK